MSDYISYQSVFQSTYVMSNEFRCIFDKKKIIGFYVVNIT